MALSTRLLSRLDLDVLPRVLEPRRARRARQLEDVREIGADYARIVAVVVRRAGPLVRPGCLTRGITLYALLRRAGADVSLCFGVNPLMDGRPEGHCWLVLDGQPFLERDDPRSVFTRIATVSSAGVA